MDIEQRVFSAAPRNGHCATTGAACYPAVERLYAIVLRGAPCLAVPAGADRAINTIAGARFPGELNEDSSLQ